MQTPVSLLTDRQVGQLLGYSRSGVWALVKRDKTFPAPVKLSPGATRWHEHEIAGWVASKREAAA